MIEICREYLHGQPLRARISDRHVLRVGAILELHMSSLFRLFLWTTALR